MSRNSTYTSTASNTSPVPNFIPVVTATGFNQGDMVFQSAGGDFQQLTSQTSTATFPNNVSQPVLSGALGGVGSSLGFPMSTSSTTTSGGSPTRNVALLTNGNFVTVSVNGSGYGYFTIYDSSFNIVVNRTTLPSTGVNGSNIGVISLTGGGFVVYFIASGTTNMAYAIYSNTGSVVTALTTVTNYTYSYLCPATSLSNGGFVLGGLSGTNTVQYNIFNSTGTSLYNAVLGMTAASASERPAFTAGASGSFAVIYRATGNTAHQWYLISSTNTTLGSGLITTSGSAAIASAATLSDGINVVFFYIQDNTPTYVYRFLNTSTYVLGTATTLNILSSANSSFISSIAVRPLSSGGFITFWQPSHNSVGNNIATHGIYYSIFNSSGTPMGSSTQTASSPVFRYLSQVNSTQGEASVSLSTIEISGNLYLFFNPFSNTSPTGPISYTNYIPISLTSYTPVPSLGYTAGFGSSTATTGTVALSGSTPTKAAYFPLSNSVTQLTSTSATATTPTRVAVYTSNNYDVCTLTNGNFVIVHRNDTTYAISASVYSPAGTLLTTLTVGTGSSSVAAYSVRITPLASGKFVIAFVSSGTNTITVNIYSANYAVTSSFTLSGLTMSLGNINNSQGFCLGSLNSDRFIIASILTSTTFPTYWVYSNTGTQLASATIASTTNSVTAINGHQAGGFSVSYIAGGGSSTLHFFGETATNTFTSGWTIAVTPAGSTNAGIGKLFVNQFNEVFLHHPINATTQNILSFISSNNNGGNWTQHGNIASTATSNLVLSIPLANGFRAFMEMSTSNTVVGTFSSTSKLLTTTLSSLTVAANTMTAVASPVYGNVAVVVYPNSADSNFIYFSLITFPFNSVQVLNTTSSVSDGVSLAGPSYPFVGVAANTAAAGAVGFVQTSGVAQLNSNYSASTPAQAFDSQTPNGLGVRGTIVGRTITLLGNT